MAKILLLGAYPPPLGGNSVHIQRLRNLIDNDLKYECKVLDLYNSEKLVSDDNVVRIGPPGVVSIIRAVLFLWKEKPDILHIHVSAMAKFLYVGLILLNLSPTIRKKLITVHSGSFVDNCRKFNFFKVILMRCLFRKFDTVVAVNDEQKKYLISQGVPGHAIHIIPAFIPSTFEVTPRVETLVSKLRQNGDKLIVTSGYGLPLYGYDKIIPVINSQDDFDFKLVMVICTYNKHDESYMAELLNSVKDQQNIVFIRDLSPGEFSYLLKSSDVYIRATDRDGDAVAIREANYFKLPVVASDAVNRPSFCEIFELDSEYSLRKALHKVLNTQTDALSLSKDEGILDKYKNVYKA